MYFPLISTRNEKKSKLYRRKGGGGGGSKGGGSSGGGKSGDGTSGSSGGTGAGSSGGAGSTGGAGRSSPIQSGGTSRTASSTSNGGGSPVSIPAGQPFAGRQAGGATRNEVYGNQVYGSGYPGIAGRGVGNRGFPFVFWPLAWGGIAGAGGAAYLHSNEYGRPDNSSRPGGVMTTAAFPSTSMNTTLRLLADNTTVTSLIASIQSDCNAFVKDSGSITATAFNDSAPAPKPEQAVQYYRASSVALTLDGYNNTGALSSDDNAPNTPLPGGIDTNLLQCLNNTIGAEVPLVESAAAGLAPPAMGMVGLGWVLWCLLSLL